MKALIRFLLIFTSIKLIVSKPQHLQQQQLQYHLDPLNEPQFEYPPKDPGKRTIGSGRHYALGKHVGIHPLGFKYVLGYRPINIKYVPVVKPVTVLKPVLQQSINQLWNPVLPPIRQYLPPTFHVPKPIHQIDHGWKPIHHHKPWADEIQHIHPVVEHEQPVEVQQLLPAVPAPLPPVQTIKPPHPLHNYFFFQTPVAKPALLPQVPLFHVARPQLPVLPLGATFPAPVLHSTGPEVVPSGPAGFPFAVPAHPPPAHIVPVPHPHTVHHSVPVHSPHAHPIHRPVVVHPQPAPVHHSIPVYPQPAFTHHPVPAYPQLVPAHHPIPVHPQPAFPAPTPPLHFHPQSGAPPPISVEFHGNRHLVPFNNQFPFTSVQSSVPFPKIPAQTPQVVVGRQPHALPLPHEVHTQLIPEIQHSLPEQPQVPSVNHFQPQVPSVHNFQPQVPSTHNFQPQVPSVHHFQPHVPSVENFQPQVPPTHHFQPQAPFNPDAAIQPGQTDLQVPVHLPDHPHFRIHHGMNHFQPTGSLEPPFPPFQNPGNILRPSISLEPPITHGHS